jgi:hypothetical protein
VSQADLRLRRYGPFAAALLSVAVVWYAWGAISPIPAVHDESSYLLQARIFAQGKWTAPSPPIAEFFEQPHVLVKPAVASKYPPGHALLLTPGARLGFPALVPLLLTAATAALLFALLARLTTPWTAALGVGVWLTTPLVLRFQPSYFSEVTTGTLVLFAWLALLRWRESRAPAWLPLLALAVGWGAITRPLTMLAFAIPIGVVVVRDVVRTRSWRSFGVAVLVGVGCLSVLPLWSARTTGSWRLSPLELYRRQYLPYDRMGFTVDTTPPTEKLSPVMQRTYEYFLTPHLEQTAARVPLTALDRAGSLAVALFQGWRLPLAALLLLGLWHAPAPLRFAAGSAALLFLAHLPYAYHAPWTVYYLETAPVVAAIVAFGAVSLFRRWRPGRESRLAALVLALLVVPGAAEAARWRRDHQRATAFDRRFASALEQLPARPAMVFMQYAPQFAQHLSVVANHPRLEDVSVWVVHDLGQRNAELRALAPGRASFDFDEAQLLAPR